MDTTNNSNSNKKKIALYLLLGIIFLGALIWFNRNHIDRMIQGEPVSNPHTVDEIFKLEEFKQIGNNYKDCVLAVFEENGYFDNHNYFLTTIPDRAKHVFAFGDFTDAQKMKELNDMAFVLEGNDFKSSCVFITSIDCNILFYKNYEDEIPFIHSFKKGAKIYINKTELEPAPVDGLILKFKYRKDVLMYNSESKNFEIYHQYDENEIKDIRNEEMEAPLDDPDNPDPVDTTEIATPESH